MQISLQSTETFRLYSSLAGPSAAQGRSGPATASSGYGLRRHGVHGVDWVGLAMPSGEEITRLRQLIRRAENDLSQLGEADRRQVTQAVDAVRATRRAVHLGMPAIRPPLQESLA